MVVNGSLKFKVVPIRLSSICHLLLLILFTVAKQPTFINITERQIYWIWTKFQIFRCACKHYMQSISNHLNNKKEKEEKNLKYSLFVLYRHQIKKAKRIQIDSRERETSLKSFCKTLHCALLCLTPCRRHRITQRAILVLLIWEAKYEQRQHHTPWILNIWNNNNKHIRWIMNIHTYFSTYLCSFVTLNAHRDFVFVFSFGCPEYKM